MQQKLWCPTEKIYFSINTNKVIVESDNEEMLHKQFDELKCPTCSAFGYGAEECGCVFVNKGSGAEYDAVICDYHKGIEASGMTIFELVPFELLKGFEPIKVKDLPKEPELKPGFGIRQKCGCWKVGDDRTFFCDFDRGIRDGLRRYQLLVNKHRQQMLESYTNKVLKTLFLSNEAAIYHPWCPEMGRTILEILIDDKSEPDDGHLAIHHWEQTQKLENLMVNLTKIFG